MCWMVASGMGKWYGTYVTADLTGSRIREIYPKLVKIVILLINRSGYKSQAIQKNVNIS